MFGTKLRSWMETHIVRSRKKQQRSKEDKTKQGSSSTKLVGSSPPSHVKSNSFEKQYDKTFSKCSKHVEDSEEMEIATTVTQFSDCKIAKTSMSLKQTENPLSCTINNLSSPESAYSTGYSTDGTSPGASVPPEYYINLRTGTHYFHANQVNNPINGENIISKEITETTSSGLLIPLTTSKVGSTNCPQAAPIPVLSPRPSRHKKEEGSKSKQSDGILRESSTEEDLGTDKVSKSNILGSQHTQIPKAQNKIIQPMHNNLHRRTESYDETSQQRSSAMFSPHHQERDSGDSSSALTTASYQCTSPYLPGASPRQRNRIRTNPWLSTQPVNGNVPIPLGASKNYNSQGETSSTVGSSSTLSSNGCKQISDEYSRKPFSPRAKERKIIMKEDIKDLKNANVQQNPLIVLNSSPRKRKPLNSVTTCSPCPSHPCRHALHSRSPALSSSSSSAPSSASEDEHHGNTSDFSDDDVTLNEMLGKFDESYIYEKETDILSDSDPTDCEEQADFEDKFDESNSFEKESCEELDFIDNGSLVELVHSDSECSSKAQNTGHCTYYQLPGYTPEMSRKLTPRLRESLLRHHRGETASNRSSRSRRNSRNKLTDAGISADQTQQSSSRRYSSRKKLHNAKKRSSENLPRGEDRQIVEINGKLVKSCESPDKPFETAGKYLNLNRVLMERLINNQRNGTRSADGTPVSLRRHLSPSDYNGKYIRNHYVSKLINSNISERRNSLEERKGDNAFDTKKRSNSLTGYSNPVLCKPPTAPSSVGVGLNDLDKEGDIKYRKLIQEAEHIIEDFQIKSRTDYLSPIFRSKSGIECNLSHSPLSMSVPQSPLALKHHKYEHHIGANNYNSQINHENTNNNPIFDKKFLMPHKSHDATNANDEGILKTISKTLEKIVRNSSDTNRKLDKSVEDPFAKGRNKMFIPSSPALFTNRRLMKNIENEHSAMLSNGLISTPYNLRRSSVGNSPRLCTFSVPITELNSNELNNESQCKKLCKNTVKNRTTSFDNGLERNDLTKNGFLNSSGNRKNTLDNSMTGKEHPTFRLKTEHIDNSDNIDTILDFSPNSNIPPHLPGIQNIPWQHRSSQAERFKHFVNSPIASKRPSDSSEPVAKQKPPLLTFRSFDLGNEHVAGTRYCPQSEPVKRKVYTCSASFGKLQKSLLRKQPGRSNTSEKLNESGGNSNRNLLKGKVAQLRKERMQVEAKVREAQEQIDRLKLTTENVGTG